MALQLELAKIPIFQFIPREQARGFSAFTKVINKNQGEVVVMWGEDVAGIFIVTKGKVGVYADQGENEISEIEPAGAFGEMSLIEHAKASATIRAKEPDTQLVLIDKLRFREQLQQSPILASTFYQGVAVTLSQRLRTTTERIAKEFDKEAKLKMHIQNNTSVGNDAKQLAINLDTMFKNYEKRLKQCNLNLKELLHTITSPAADKLKTLMIQMEKEYLEEIKDKQLIMKKAKMVAEIIANIESIIKAERTL